jgi:PIN domain nuclease of toxin-antitoxin system
MKLLLDTCTFLWITLDKPSLSIPARTMFNDPANEVFLSSVSAWEISVKYGLGRLPLPDTPEKFVTKQRILHGIEAMSLSEEEALHVPNLPLHHKDPFDRLLVCQAILQGMTILTPDSLIRQYPVLSAW